MVVERKTFAARNQPENAIATEKRKEYKPVNQMVKAGVHVKDAKGLLLKRSIII